MELTLLIFLSSGLFLGWSLGANDAANVFGTAVGSRMVRFSTAAIISSLFVVLGATISGGGAAHMLGKLGEVNALGGAFTAAFAAAITVYWMTKARLPVSTSQAIVGAIVGWNLFAGAHTELDTMSKIVMTWVLCPVLAAITAALLYKAVSKALLWSNIHLLTLDSLTRFALIAAGAFGAYSLGANNIANVMGVFVSSHPFEDLSVTGFMVSGTQQLFLLGAIAIGVGIFTYSKRVMLTVGSGLMPLTPLGAWVVVMAHSIVLFLFASEGLEHFLASHGLPTVPLVPVSSSQAVVGAVIGIGLLTGGTQLDWKVAGRIASGWVTTPLIAALVSVFSLFVLQNVFLQTVREPIEYQVGQDVVERMREAGLPAADLAVPPDRVFPSASRFSAWLRNHTDLDRGQIEQVLHFARLQPLQVDLARLDAERRAALEPRQLEVLQQLDGRAYQHPWQLEEDLARLDPAWALREETVLNKQHNKHVRSQIDLILDVFEDAPPSDD